MPAPGELQLRQTAEGVLTVALAGSWKLTEQLPSADEVMQKLDGSPAIGRLAFDTRQLTDWDSGLLIFLTQLNEFCAQKKIPIDGGGLPQGARKLLALAAAVPEKKDARRAAGRVSFLTHVGSETVDLFKAAGDMLAFIGDTVVALGNLLRGKALYRKTDLWLVMESCGGQALPIVTLISFLVGIDPGLRRCDPAAAVRRPDLRGRPGRDRHGARDGGHDDRHRHGRPHRRRLCRPAGHHAGQRRRSMRSQTLGISPMEFLVLPRMMALALMMPLLCLYADVMGILGGMVVGVGMLDIGVHAVLQRDRQGGESLRILASGFVQGIGVRRTRGDLRLPAGHAVRAQRLGGGRCGHLGGGDRHRGDHRLDRRDHGAVQHSGDLNPLTGWPVAR